MYIEEQSLKSDDAADNLVGITLDTGWEVIEKISRHQGSTGGFFSVCYRVKKNDEFCFLKAFPFSKFLNPGQNKSIVDSIADMLDAFRYERDLSNMCRDKYVTKVAFVKSAGEQNVSGYAIQLVPYLIFDLADGDVRGKLTFSQKLDNAWKLKSLHSIAVGLKQLHAIGVSHQDLKPSNVLLFQNESKIGDLGRSTCLTIDSPYKSLAFSGDKSYAPPEILYNAFENDWTKRSFAADCYLFGSMIVFYFAGVTMNALLRKYIPNELSWEYYNGSFNIVKTYLLAAFSESLSEFESRIEDVVLKKELRLMVENLCHPLPEKRGNSKMIASAVNQYNLQQFISSLNYLHEKVKYDLKH